MLRADGREVAPHLAPAADAVAVLGADEHRRPLTHLAERGDDRCGQRIAEAECLDAVDGEHHLTSSRRTPGPTTTTARNLQTAAANRAATETPVVMGPGVRRADTAVPPGRRDHAPL